MDSKYWDRVAKDYHKHIVSPFYNEESTQAFLYALGTLQSPEVPFTVLDMGCGKGHLLPALAKRARQVYGTDFSRNMLPNTQIATLVQANHTALPFDNGAFNEVYCINALLSPERQERFEALGEIVRVLQGAFFGLFPSNENYLEQSYALKETLIENGREENAALLEVYEEVVKRRYDPIGGFIDVDDQRIKLYNKVELEDILEQVGFSDIIIIPFRYPLSVADGHNLIMTRNGIYDWLVRARVK